MRSPKNNDRDIEKAFAKLWELYQKDWVFFIEHALGHATWSKQREIIWSVQYNQRTAVHACHGSSKTFTAAEIAVTIYNLFSDSMVITTAPTGQQVESLLWTEINQIYQNSLCQLKGRILNTDIKDDENPRHFALGFATNKPARAEGWHSWNPFFLFDEAKGIESWMWNAARGACTGGNYKWLVISTTDGVEIGSEYWKCLQPGSGWNKIHISAYDSPFLTGEKFHRLKVNPDNPFDFEDEYINPDDMHVQLANKEYIEENKDHYKGFGEGTVLWLTKVLGKIADQGPDSVIKLSSVMKMSDNHRNPAFVSTGKKRGGIDCAWGGLDDMVCFKSQGLKILDQPLVVTSRDLPQESIISYQCDQIEKYYMDKSYELRIDADGGGIGVVSEMQKRGWTVLPVHNGGKPMEENKYMNKISEIWYTTRDILHLVACPEIDRLTRELTQRKWYGLSGMDKSGRMGIEEKSEYKKRFSKSPDFADAFMYCIADLIPASYASEGREID